MTENNGFVTSIVDSFSPQATNDKIEDVENGLYDIVKDMPGVEIIVAENVKCLNGHKIAERNKDGTIEIKCHRCKHITEVK